MGELSFLVVALNLICLSHLWLGSAVEILSIITGKHSFCSGGNVVTFYLGAIPNEKIPDAFNLVLLYFPANESEPFSNITASCELSNPVFLTCQLPNVCEIYKIINGEHGNSTLVIEPFGDYGGCQLKEANRLCLSLITGNRKRIRLVVWTQQNPEALEQVKLYVYPNPRILNVAFSNETSDQLRISGSGLRGDDILLASYSIELKIGNGSMPCYMSFSKQGFTAYNSESDVTCSFNQTMLGENLEQLYHPRYRSNNSQHRLPVKVVIRNGNWEEVQNVTYLYQVILPEISPDISTVAIMTGQLQITGTGLSCENLAVMQNYRISLANSSLSCSLELDDKQTFDGYGGELLSNNDSQLVCNFNHDELDSYIRNAFGIEYLSRHDQIPIDVSIRNGKWKYNTNVMYPTSAVSLAATVNSTAVHPSTSHRSGLSPNLIAAIVVPLSVAVVIISLFCIFALAVTKLSSQKCDKIYRKIVQYVPAVTKCVKPSLTKTFRLMLRQYGFPENLLSSLIDRRRLEVGEEIGRGNFGIVNKGWLKLAGLAREEVALKSSMIRRRGMGEDFSKDFLREIVIMSSFDHDNVLGIRGVTILPNDVLVVILPLMYHGNLLAYVQKYTIRVYDDIIVDFGLQVANGMKYLAEKHVIHRDIAARNCLLNQNRIVKIADFGLSVIAEESTEGEDAIYTPHHVRELPERWMAPETFPDSRQNRIAFSEKSDVWSFGVLLWELGTRGAKPYSDPIRIQNVRHHVCIEKGRLPQHPTIGDRFYSIMSSCWATNPNERPSFAELVQIMDQLRSDVIRSDLPDDESVGYVDNNAAPGRSIGDLVMEHFNAITNSKLDVQDSGNESLPKSEDSESCRTQSTELQTVSEPITNSDHHLANMKQLFCQVIVIPESFSEARKQKNDVMCAIENHRCPVSPLETVLMLEDSGDSQVSSSPSNVSEISENSESQLFSFSETGNSGRPY